METAIIGTGAALVIAILIAAVALVLTRRPAAGGDQLAGQLQVIAAAQAAAQAALDQRLAALEVGVQDRLSKNSEGVVSSLSDLKERLSLIDAAQKNIAELSGRVVDLQDVLSNKQARGAFGEVQLMDLVQQTLAPSQYEFQATLSSGKRVDCLLKLPTPPGSIGIDAKFPLEAYRALCEAKDDQATLVARREFTTAIRAHVKAIAEKYIVPGETADSALMFLPSEAVYAELHTNFQNLVDEAIKARVWIVSPTTMMATLTTMRAVLKDVRMREQAHVIQQMVSELQADLTRLDQRVTRLGTHFEQAQEDVRQIRISTDKAIKKSAKIEAVGLEDADVAAIADAAGGAQQTLQPRSAGPGPDPMG